MTEPRESSPLIDVHAHFHYDGCGTPRWEHQNRRRLEAGAAIGISWHVGSVLGSWGANSPTYFQSPADTVAGNDAMLAVERANPECVRSYVAVNPNDTSDALREIDRCAVLGAIGLKLAAARRCGDAILAPLVSRAGELGFPVLHHIWQHRRRHWPGQDASDANDLVQLAERHPEVRFILAHIGGGGDYAHTFAAVRYVPNILLDLSGSGVDCGMLDGALEAVGPQRLLWGADITLCTGLAKLRALEVIGLSADQMEDVRWRNAVRIFPQGAFDPMTGGR